MLAPLSPDTIFERRLKAQRDRWLLMGALLIAQGFFIYLMILALVLVLVVLASKHTRVIGFGLLFEPGLFWLAMGLAVVLTLVQAWAGWKAQRRGLREDLEARDLDLDDDRHRDFAKVVKAVGLAAGLPGARAMVTPRAGFNSYGWQDPDGRAVIGISEGLLGRLNAAELAAVGAHHAAHIRFGDARLFMFAASVVGVFDFISEELGRVRSGDRHGGGPPVLLLLMVSTMAESFTRLVFGLVVKGRKLHADAAAVAMTMDPLALASALHTAQKASLTWRDLPESLAPLLLVPGTVSDLNSHSPLAQRVNCLLEDAHSELRVVERRWHERRSQRPMAGEKRRRYWHYEGATWTGPWQLAALRARPGFDGRSWVSPEGAAPRRALMDEALGALFKPGSRAVGRCPRCGIGLVKDRREGLGVLLCRNCGGHALGRAAIARMVLRQDEGFPPTVYAEAERLREREWRRAKKGLEAQGVDPVILCPGCGGEAKKRHFSSIAKVVVDACADEACGTLWLDGGELELIQVLTEEPELGAPPKPTKPYEERF